MAKLCRCNSTTAGLTVCVQEYQLETSSSVNASSILSANMWEYAWIVGVCIYAGECLLWEDGCWLIEAGAPPQPQIVFTSELGHPPKFKDTNRGEDEINMSENYNDKKTRYDSKVSKN